MNMVQTPIGNLPIQLVCIETGSIAFVPLVPMFPVFFDIGEPEAIIDKEGLHIGEDSFSFNTAYVYKRYPSLVQWLQRQNLISPF
jgi:hypothetical protein